MPTNAIFMPNDLLKELKRRHLAEMHEKQEVISFSRFLCDMLKGVIENERT